MNKLIVLLLLAPCLHGADIYVHMMPWFETKETNNGTWGQHWTMANCNPDDTDENGLQDLCTFYHPQIGAYASGDPDVIDWQLGLMKTAGIAGIFIDWPGTYDKYDYAPNMRNAEAIIEGTKRHNLKFSIVYEDNNLNLAAVPDPIAQGQADMNYIKENYFSQDNFVQVHDKPLLLDFGPQALYSEQWDEVLSVLGKDGVTFVPLWNQGQQAGSYVEGEFSWVWADYVDSLITWYAHRNVSVKIGVAYPGFHPYYGLGGWPGPMFWIDYGVETFNTTFQLAIDNVDIIQICTWNDYGEGTIIEPTVETGTAFLDVIQEYTGAKFTHDTFKELTDIYFLKKKHSNDNAMLEELRKQHFKIVNKFD